jgi:microcystin-dependent protein
MFADGVMESSNTVGTADYALAGAVYNGRTFGSVFADSDPVCFIVQTLKRDKFEIVRGEYQIGPPRKLLRTEILLSSQGGAKVDWQVDDDYYIASFSSATVLAGLIKMHLANTRPWWVQFGRWLRNNVPSAGLITEYFYDGATDIKLGVVDPTTHVYESVYAPAGEVRLFAGDTAPFGFLFCHGQSVLRASYPSLFAVIGTKFGSADGTHFNLPDTRGRYILGFDGNATGRTTIIDPSDLGNTGGAEDTVAPLSAVTGTTAADSTAIPTGPQGSAGSGGGSGIAFALDNHVHSIPALDVSLSGDSGTFSVLPPSIVLDYIISTGGV